MGAKRNTSNPEWISKKAMACVKRSKPEEPTAHHKHNTILPQATLIKDRF